MRSRVQEVFADAVLGEKLKTYSSTEMEGVKLDFVSTSQTMVLNSLLSDEWIDDGSLDNDEIANAGRKALWSRYVESNFAVAKTRKTYELSETDETEAPSSSKLDQANAAVESQWNLICEAVGVGDVSSWTTGDAATGTLSADATQLA